MTDSENVPLTWLNEPADWSWTDSGLRATAAPQSDFWQRTHDGGARDNGHFFYRQATGDFTARVAIQGDYNALYDQAGLMVRVDAEHWLKCGIELVGSVQQASVVVTRQWSDWSVRPVGTPAQIYLQCIRQADTFEVAFSLDGKSYEMLRQTFLTETPQVDVGMMLAAPKGAGFEAHFQQFSVANAPS